MKTDIGKGVVCYSVPYVQGDHLGEVQWATHRTYVGDFKELCHCVRQCEGGEQLKECQGDHSWEVSQRILLVICITFILGVTICLLGTSTKGLQIANFLETIIEFFCLSLFPFLSPLPLGFICNKLLVL